MSYSRYPACPVDIADMSAPTAVVDAGDPEFPVVWINAAFVTLTGMRWSEVVGLSATAFIGAATSTAVLAALSTNIVAGGLSTHILRIYRRDGSALWCEITFAPVRDVRGHLTHWVLLLRDSSPERAVSAERTVTRAELAHVTADLTALATASDVASEVENPLMLAAVEQIISGSLADFARFILCAESGFQALQLDTTGLETVGHGLVPDPVANLVRIVPHLPRWVRLDEVEPALQPMTAAVVALVRHDLPEGADEVRITQLAAGNQVLGLLVTCPRGREPADVRAIDLIGRRIAAALANAAALWRERTMATALQTALLPKRVHREDLDVWAYYSPSSEHTQVGGDWYDVSSVGPDVVAAVVGDAVGADVNATAVMGQYRAIVRAFGMELVDPSAVLERSDAVGQAMRIPRPASVVYASFFREPLVGAPPLPAGALRGEHYAWSVFYSRAGHLPPLLLRGSDVRVLDEAAGHMLGFGTGNRPQAEVALEPGDVVVLYTDGLIERRDRPLRAGMFLLVNALAQCRGDATEIGEELIARLAADQHDDVAVVVVRIPRQGELVHDTARRSRSQRWSLPSDPASVARARHHGARLCTEWGVERAADVELVITELVANAVEHGGGLMKLRIFEVPDGVRVEVEDGNPTPPVAVEGHQGQPGGIGMRFVAQLATWGWKPTHDGKLVWAVINSETN